MADKQTVKVGDKVRCLVTEFDVRKGELYEVLKVQDSGRVWCLDDVSDRFYLDVDEYELLPVAEATGKPAFKVGDRVKAINTDGVNNLISVGKLYTVASLHFVNGVAGPILKDVETFGQGFKPERFELAPARTIETGKFYRTRDGRKVGPVDEWISDQFRERARDGRYWTVDGVGHGEAKGEDLIAEWVDEPASNDNAPATAPAIVALIEGGEPKPSEQPKVHKSEQAATDEAERLAVKYPGQKFGVFVLVDSRIADVFIRRAA